MNSPSRTNQELINEISILKLRIQELEKSEAGLKQAEKEADRNQDIAERLAGEMSIIAEIGRIIGSTLAINEVYERMATEIGKLVPFDSLMVNLRNAQQETLVVTYISGLDIPGRRVGDSFLVRGTIGEEAIQTKKGVIRQSENPEDLVSKFPGLIVSVRAGMRSVMTVPLIFQAEVIGNLIIRSQKPNAYDEDNLRLAEKIGIQIAGAIANALLFNDLSKAEKALRESNELFSLYMRHSPIYTYIKEVTPTESTVLQASDNFRKMIGIPGSEMVGKTMAELFPADFGAKITADDWAVVSSGHVLQLDEELNGRSYTTIKFPIARGDRTLLAGYTMDITERKRAEDALWEREEKYRSLFNNAEVGMFRTRLDGSEILDMNERFLQIFSRTREEMHGSPSMIHWADQREREEMVHRLKAEGRVGNFECRMLNKWGEEKNCLASLRVYPEQEILEGSIIDITERKQAEKALRQSEEKFRLLFERSNDAIFLVNIWTGRYLDANRAAEKLTGRSIDELKRLRTKDVCRSGAIDRLAKLRSANETIDLKEVEYVRPDGTTRTALLTAVPLNESIFYGIARDITDRKQAEEQLVHVNQQNELILGSAAEGILGLDFQGKQTFVNPAAARMLGYEVEELLGRSSHGIWHHTKPDGSSYPDEECEIRATYREGAVHRASTEVFWRKDGTSFPVEYESKPIFERGRLVGAVVTFRDITDRKRTEEEKRNLQERLQRSEKMEALGQLAGGVAHDLNNVLGVSTIYSELLQEEIPEGNMLRSCVDNILSSNEKAAAIIEDLLTLARRSVTASEVMNVNTIVGIFLKTPVFEKIQAFHPNVAFRFECDEELMNIKGSPVHIEKTLLNLVSNAAEAIQTKGEVVIRTQNLYLEAPVRGYDEVKEGDYTVLTVSDTGTGIPAEHIGKIFEPFYTKKTMGRSGTGLGLAIVWGTVKDHHGYIDVQTEVGEGTTFTLYFPVTREEMIAQQQKVPIEQYMGSGESVLVVDDIAEQRAVASRLLTRLGYEVHVVPSGEEAVEYLTGNKADILVLDMIMAPRMDGLETYERVLEINPKQKAIIVSGFSETDRVKKAQKLGAGAYVRKPYIMEKIGVAIRDELRRI